MTILKIRKNCVIRHSFSGFFSANAAIAIVLMLLVPIVSPFFTIQTASAAVSSILRSNELVYVPGDSLTLYGKSDPNDILVARIFDPTGRAIRIENIPTDEDGFFKESIFVWPAPTKNLPYGMYNIQLTSSKGNTLEIEVTFAEGVEEGIAPRVPKAHILAIKMDSPTQVPVGSKFRIFVQVTFDGALVDSDDPNLLSASHMHSGRGNSTINISNFIKLHEGLYYADIQLDVEGSFVIHSAVFYRGYLSHESRVVTASATSINTIQDSVNRLDLRLNSTNQELNRLETRLDDTRSALTGTELSIKNSLEEARTSIKEDIEAAKISVENLENASGQVNSIILPVLALISVIIALQISLFARIRASYR